MPNYIVNTAQFNPIDFETRIKPIADYTEFYNKEMDALDEAGVLGNTIGGLIDPNKDAELLKVYNNYNNLLNDTVDSMMSDGNLNTARNNLRALRSKYANELLPIQQGYTSWQEAIKNYDAQKAKDPTFIGNDPRKYSISNYMQGNSPQDYYVSGELLYNMGMKDAAAASARHIVQGNWKLDPSLLNEYFSKIDTIGWNQEDINAALLDNIIEQRGNLEGVSREDLNTVSDYIINAYNRIANSSNINAFDNDENYNRAGNYIINGIMAGLSYDEKSDKIRNEKDELYWAKLEEAKLDNEYKKARNKITELSSSDTQGDYNTPYDLVDSVEVSKDRKATAETYTKLADIIRGVNSGDINLKDVAIKGSISTVGGSNVSSGTTVTTPDITYEELLKDLIDKFDINGITFKSIENEIDTGKTKSKIEMTPEAEQKLNLALAATIQLSSDKRFKNADSNKRVISHLNNRIISTVGNGLVLDENGKDITNRGVNKKEAYQIPEGAQILLTSSGKLVAVTKDRKRRYLDPSLISGSEQKNIEFKGERLSVSEAMSHYARMYDTLNNLDMAVSPEAYFSTSVELSELSDAVLRALDAEANNYPIVQSTSGKIEN